MKFAENLRELRRKKNLTQEQLANLVNVRLSGGQQMGDERHSSRYCAAAEDSTGA